jgi:tRNA(Ile)-lysidine synthase
VRKESLTSEFLSALNKLVGEDPFSKTYLIGVSGGSDSMCLSHLFLQCGLIFSIAHVNYSLRGRDSIEDQDFVISWAKQVNIPCFTKTVDAREIQKIEGGNLQELARDIRYTFFEECRKNEKIDFVCTAHHSSDWLETMLLNFFRGGLLKAMVGMPERKGFILRPLLYVDKSRISDYLMHNKISFRVDAGNNSLLFKRNFVRHKIVPLIQSINPSILSTLLRNKNIWSELIALKNDFVVGEVKRIVTSISENEFLISLDGLKQSRAPGIFLYDYLTPLGFTPKMILELEKKLGGSFSNGNIFIQGDWQIIKIEHYLKFLKTLPRSPLKYSLCIQETGCYSILNQKILSIKKAGSIPELLNLGSNIIFVDEGKITFPLEIRKWNPGDYFYPLNMNQHRKKVQDYLTDRKVDKLRKQDVLVLVNGNEQIIWIVGFRQDNRFKIDSNTEHVLIFEHKTD